MARLAEARRGAAWLELLKAHPPEPSASLIERILAQTAVPTAIQTHDKTAVRDSALSAVPAASAANVLPFVARPPRVSAITRFTRLAMEPRLAMTAAMAFFSIALTLNLLGVRFDQLHTADLKPANLKRSYFEAKASAVRYSDNLRVVRVLESRVEDFRQGGADDAHDRLPARANPSTEGSQPSRRQQRPDHQVKPATPGGSSRRDSPLPENPSTLRAIFVAARMRPELTIS